ncbi:polyphosphate kinase 1 [Prochlorococcus sp. MIT 1341]|uniref:polyphosphate kinase 1 n=1 Tax=Prochlorococcus sp. MIT 1341 TaxID=3096221 RepID=UPI002A752448|nr:polyphosphate kinase 1 [Prochlorococcus sp. MIT 1341]
MINTDKTRKGYINRELSWISFNFRVLSQALDIKTPLIEQAKFSAIFSNNLDEFFMVRIASLKSQVEAGITKLSEDGRTASEQLEEIRKRLLPILKLQANHYHDYLKNELRRNRILIVDYEDLNEIQTSWINSYFKTKIFPVLTPLAVDPAHPFPYVSNLSLNVAAIIIDPEKDQEQFVRVKIPQKSISRFISIPTDLDKSTSNAELITIPLEQIIGCNLRMLFPGMKIKEHYFFRVTRDADLELRDIEADDLMIAIEEGLRKRRLGGEIVRLEVSDKIPVEILNMLIKGLSIKEEDVYMTKTILGLDDLLELSTISNHRLKFKHHVGKTCKPLKHSQTGKLETSSSNKDEFKDIFSIIKNKDILLHHPYDLFSTSVEEFINQAAEDPDVLAIKMTLYRIAKDSQVIKALIRAAESGKQVMALVELRARFDEDNNIQWAKQLEQSGVHVVYGVVGLKTHTKIALVIRNESNKLKSYVHIGTGNYNCKTSKLYTDLGLLSAREDLGKDLVELFNYLTGFAKQQTFRKLLVAPVSLRKGIETLIHREIKNHKEGKGGVIRAKMNSLVDPNIINLLYEASQEGVKIELIIRGMCCLYPGVKGLSENIQVISVIGQFLEHSRIFWFYNGGEKEAYIGSADFMRRNLDRRIEAVTPIEDTLLLKRIEQLLAIYLNDNCAAWDMQNDGTFVQRKAKGQQYRAQDELIAFWETL